MIQFFNPKRRSISKEVTLGLIFIVAVVSSIALVISYGQATKRAERQLEAKADEYIAFLKNILVLPLWNYDFETINAVGQTYLQNDFAAGISIFDGKGKSRFSQIFKKKPISTNRSAQLYYKGIFTGRVEISLTATPLTQLRQQYIWSFAITVTINLLSLVLLTGLLMRRSLKKPLSQLDDIVTSYGVGNSKSIKQDMPYVELRSFVETLQRMGKQIDEQLTVIQHAERKYRSIFENALEGIYQSTLDGRILSANPAFARILGYDSAEQLIKRTVDISEQHWLNPNERRDMVQKLLDDGIVTALETRMIRRDGQLIWALINGRPVYDASGNLLYLEGMVQDITEKVRLEDQIRQTQKMEAIGTLAGGIAHDFNNMLGVIIGCSELAMDGTPENSKAAADMERVLDAGLRAKNLVRQILTFSRQSESELKPLIIRPFLKEVVKFLQTTLPATVEIRLSSDPNNFTVLADPTQLQQVLLNLCTNSAHALSRDGGVIEVSLAERIITSLEDEPITDLVPGAYVNLTVQDNGLGIERENLHRVFDPFFTTKKVGEGTGLGLSVVHGIIKSHGGTVYAESKPGQGTTMQVLLPSLEHPGFEPAPESTVVAPEGSEEIFLVEDEPVLADILYRILSGLGYQVKQFTNATEAWAYFEDNSDRFDLILLDHNMPTITGVELAARINRLQPELPIILFTGINIELLRQDAEKAGVRTLINKPLNRIELSLAIRKVLDEPS